MTIDFLLSFLGWGIALNLLFLIFWALLLIFMSDCIFQLQTRWLQISREYFNLSHFILIGTYKLAVIVFFLIPYVALRIVV